MKFLVRMILSFVWPAIKDHPKFRYIAKQIRRNYPPGAQGILQGVSLIVYLLVGMLFYAEFFSTDQGERLFWKGAGRVVLTLLLFVLALVSEMDLRRFFCRLIKFFSISVLAGVVWSISQVPGGVESIVFLVFVTLWTVVYTLSELLLWGVLGYLLAAVYSGLIRMALPRSMVWFYVDGILIVGIIGGTIAVLVLQRGF